jgi:hypothetical protein
LDRICDIATGAVAQRHQAHLVDVKHILESVFLVSEAELRALHVAGGISGRLRDDGFDIHVCFKGGEIVHLCNSLSLLNHLLVNSEGLFDLGGVDVELGQETAVLDLLV